MILRYSLYFLLLFIVTPGIAQKQWRWGAFYSFGAAFNFNKTNDTPWKPRDISSLGVLTRLDNGENALGFQAGVALRWNDVRHTISNGYYLDNGFRSWELRLQCTMPLGKKSTVALGIAPRLVYHHSFSMVYLSSANGGQSEYNVELRNDQADLNELNSAVILSWQYELHRRWFFHLNVDQDMLPSYAQDVVFENYDANQPGEQPVKVNGLVTSVTGSIVFFFK